MNEILNEKEYKNLFKSVKRFSALVSTLTNILESERTDEAKLKLITSISEIATESLCRICLFDNQDEQPAYSKGLCHKHYRQHCQGLKGKKNKDNLPVPVPVSRRLYPETCAAPGCERKHFSHGYCNFHHSRVYKAGIDPTDLESMNQPPRTTRKQLNDESE